MMSKNRLWIVFLIITAIGCWASMFKNTPAFAANTSIDNNSVSPQASAPITKALPILAKPDLKKTLAIAEKYYNLALSNATSYEKPYIPLIFNWKPDFTGKTKNPANVAQHLNSSAYLVNFTNLKGLYLPLSSAVFAFDIDNAASAGNLASAIASYCEDSINKPLGDAIKVDNGVKSYADDAAAVYEYALALLLEKPAIDLSAMPLLLNYGYLNIDRGELDAAKLMFETATKLAPEYLPAAEGMAAYWLAKGDKNKAQQALEGAKMPLLYSAAKKMIENTTDKKTLVDLSDNLSVIEDKLKAESAVQPVLATDFYEDVDPDGADQARRFVADLASQFKYTAPNYNYLSQYSTLEAVLSPLGWSAFQAFQSELAEFEKKFDAANAKQQKDSSMYSLMVGILQIDPGNYANPTDILAQQKILAMLRRKLFNYEAFFAKLNEEKGELVGQILIDDAERWNQKYHELEKAMNDKIDQLNQEYPAPLTELQEKEYQAKLHAIRQTYYPQMNQLTATIWMDGVNTVNSRYTQYIKPYTEAMYTDCMHNCLLISDPQVRELWEDYINYLTLLHVYSSLGAVEQAYSFCLDTAIYPLTDDYQENSSESQQTVEDADAAKTAQQNQARKDFESGAIPNNSQLYKKLDTYSASFHLLFMDAKWHPLKTEVSFNVKLPIGKGGTDVSLKQVQDHVRNTVTYEGGLGVTVKSMSAGNGAISGKASVTLKGEITTDGNYNVVGGDVAGSAQGTVTIGNIKATGEYEASVMRGCKMSGEVDQVYNDKIINNTVDPFGGYSDLSTFRPNLPKKVLWKGEYKVNQ